jgi:hypothetical protein
VGEELMRENKKNLLYAMIINWVIVLAIGISMGIVLQHDLNGIEWFGSPLLSCSLMGISMTVLYFASNKRTWKITEIILFFFANLFVFMILNMITLAYCILGSWERFQAMPIMGTFQLLVIAFASHFMVQHMKRTPLNVIVLWTTVVFVFITSTMIFLALSIFSGWENWQILPIIGTGTWLVLSYLIYLSSKSADLGWITVIFWWLWFLFVGIGTSMFLVYWFDINISNYWPIYPILGAFLLAVLGTILKLTIKTKQEKFRMK